MTKGRYVDDISGGADSLPQLINIAQQLNELYMAGGFPLAQWKSNHPEILPKFSSAISQGDEHTFDDSSIKVLGFSWIPKSDKFKFVSNVSNNLRISKRVILSEIAQLYDPLGFISPVIIKGKWENGPTSATNSPNSSRSEYLVGSNYILNLQESKFMGSRMLLNWP